MPLLAHLTFQGEPALSARLGDEALAELRREAFPRSPPRGATSDPGYRAFKLHPMADGRLLVSSVHNAGDRDPMGRPVLRACALLLQPEELRGPQRDVGSVWRALLSGPVSLEDLEGELTRRSALLDARAHARLMERLTREPERVAALAAILGESSMDLHLGVAEEVYERLGPALLLVPLSRLCRLQLCSGAVPGEARERVLVLGEAPARERGGLLRGLGAALRSARAVHVYDAPSPDVDPAALDLVRAVGSPEPWPLVPDLERLRLLVESIDGLGPGSLWEAAPELRALRRAMRRVAEAEQALRGWR